MTKDAVRERRKTVTRRRKDTWKNLREGDRLIAVDRVMGFRKGERAEILGTIEVVDVRVEPLEEIFGEVDPTAAEGFPDLSPREFVDIFCREMKVGIDAEVRRIEFCYVCPECGGVRP